MSLIDLLPTLASSSVPKLLPTPKLKTDNRNLGAIVLPKLLSLALAVTLTSPLPSSAVPSLNSQSPPISFTTPFSQSKNLQVGLENGKIRPCPSVNPGCISTNPKSSSFAFPWLIPENSLDNPIQKLREAILKTQKNVKFQLVEDTPDGNTESAQPDVFQYLTN